MNLFQRYDRFLGIVVGEGVFEGLDERQVLKQSFREVLRRQKYQVVGASGAVKKCRWLHKGLWGRRGCYKGKFYGVESHRCIQLTPVLPCNLRCLFCWRTRPEDLGLKEETLTGRWVDPDLFVEEALEAQRRILSGYRGQVLAGRISRERYQEALNPCHVAISLDGEPTLYPHLDPLIGEFKRRGFTTFLVTNGTRPKVISSLDEEPSQLYLSLYAPDLATFTKICRPPVRGLWNRVMQTAQLLPSFKNPTVVRLTLVKEVNMGDPEGYGRIIEEASPTYVEAKAYMFVGASRLRLQFENMPSHRDVREFSQDLASTTGYMRIDEDPDSRVILLSKSKKVRKLR